MASERAIAVPKDPVRLRFAASVSLAVLALTPASLAAQEGAAPGTDTAQTPVEVPDARDPVFTGEQNEGLPQGVPAVPGQRGSQPREIGFEADTLSYDEPSDTVSASGNVILRAVPAARGYGDLGAAQRPDRRKRPRPVRRRER